jgi:hypothetical protein
MVTTIGDSTSPIRFGDNETPGSGTYEVYLPGQFVPARKVAIPIDEYEASTKNDALLNGTFRYDFQVRNNVFQKYVNGSLSDWEKLNIAWSYWARQANGGSVLYYSEKNAAGYNIRQTPKSDYSGMETMRVKLLEVVELAPEEENSVYYIRFDAFFKQVNPVTRT